MELLHGLSTGKQPALPCPSRTMPWETFGPEQPATRRAPWHGSGPERILGPFPVVSLDANRLFLGGGSSAMSWRTIPCHPVQSQEQGIAPGCFICWYTRNHGHFSVTMVGIKSLKIQLFVENGSSRVFQAFLNFSDREGKVFIIPTLWRWKNAIMYSASYLIFGLNLIIFFIQIAELKSETDWQNDFLSCWSLSLTHKYSTSSRHSLLKYKSLLWLFPSALLTTLLFPKVFTLLI